MTCFGEDLRPGWYRDPETLAAELEEHGGLRPAAAAHGVHHSTLLSWAKKGNVPTSERLAVPLPGDEVSDVEVLRARNAELERHLRRERAADVDAERVVRRIEAAIENAGRRPVSAPAPRRRERPSLEEQEMVLLFSDTHASEVVRADETMRMNDYSWATMLDRMARLRDAVLSHREHLGFPVRKLQVWMLGDMLSGDIHDELAITNDRPTAEAVVDFAYDASDWLAAFLDEFETVEVAGVPGNHPRASKKPAAKLAHNNADWLTYKMIEALFKREERVSFNVRRGSFNVATVAGRWRALLMHGDGIRTTMPGVPWGGVVRRITTLEQQFTKAKTPIDYVALGHFHTANTLDGVQARTFLNGSVKGLDEYSLKAFGSGRDACQLLLTFHPRRGWTGTLPIDLQDVGPASEGWTVAA